MPATKRKTHDIEADYPVLSLVAISDRVVSDLANYFDRPSIYESRDAIADALAVKLRKVYRLNERFRKRLKPTKANPNRHRDQLYVWFQHWITPELRRLNLLTFTEQNHLVSIGWTVGDPFVRGTTYRKHLESRGS